MFQSLRPIDRAAAASDVTAGVELAAMSMPQSLGYASIAGMPPVSGLYTLLLPLAGFSTFGSSRYLVVAADSATAAIVAGGLSGMAREGSARYVMLASLVALLTAAFLLLARILKLGFLADFLSQTVLTGFLTGVGFQVAIAVLGQMMGISVDSHRTILQLIEVVRKFPEVHLPSLVLSALVVIGVLALSRFPHIPAPLIAVFCSVAASAIWDFQGHGFAVIGSVARGLPHLSIPEVGWNDFELLIPIAVSCFVMIVTQSAATARMYALSNRQRLDENADLSGLAVANGLAALSGTFVVNGSPTQTTIVESAGSKSQLAQVSAAVVVALVLLFFTRPLEYLPRCVLGSIVFIVAIRLMKLRELRDIRRESPGEFVLAATTAAVVMLLGVEQGIVLAMVMSLLRIVQHSYHPHTGVLVHGDGDIWRVTPAVPGAVSEPGLAIYRFGAPLFYANAGRFADEIRGLVEGAPSSLRWILIDASPITKLDFSAARIVKELHAELAARQVALAWAHVEPSLQADLDRHHLKELSFEHLHNAIAHYHNEGNAPSAASD